MDPIRRNDETIELFEAFTIEEIASRREQFGSSFGSSESID